MWRNLFDIFFPNLCVVCSRSLASAELHCCVGCMAALPYFDEPTVYLENLEALLGVRSIEGFVFFEKDSRVQVLLHAIKYKSCKELGRQMGRLFGEEMAKQAINQKIDCIVPMPIHSRRRHQRGYNQSELLAEGLGEVLEKPVLNNHLFRVKYSESQTRVSKEERLQHTQGAFVLQNAPELSGKRILLVDDVLTTGATAEAACKALRSAPSVELHLACLAVARRS